MTYIVTESCINCRYTDCVDVCPVDCFHQGPNFLVINPETCIDCGVCVDECPVNAIVEASVATPEQQPYIALNAERAQQWPVISEKTTPLPEAEKWSKVKDKFAQLETA
jgi:ferredoxin